MQPLISIITPTLNARATLEETLRSVEMKEMENGEHLIIDARSSDQTLEIASRFSHLRVVSEPDRGIYDGMNKGARLAQGEWLLFLQADDWLPEGTLSAYKQAISANPDVDMICGSAEAVKFVSDRWATLWSVHDVLHKTLTIKNIALGEPMLNARLIRREVFLRLGGFSLAYSLASDRDFLLRASGAGITHAEISAMTYRYRWHPASSTMTEGNSLTGRLSKENLTIAKCNYFAAKPHAKAVLRKWHTRLTVQAAMNGLESFEWRNLLRTAREGVAVDLLWPLHFISEIIRSLPGFLVRGGRTRSQLLNEVKSK